MAEFVKKGYGQIEPNHLSAQRTYQIYAQLPANSEINVLENGQFAKYDYANHEVNYTGTGEWMLVYNEVKLYDDVWRESYKDFALKRDDQVGKILVPRVFKTNVGDIFTTNCVKNETINAKDYLTPGAAGILEKIVEVPGTHPGKMLWQVADITTMPDGQPAVKIQRVQ